MPSTPPKTASIGRLFGVFLTSHSGKQHSLLSQGRPLRGLFGRHISLERSAAATHRALRVANSSRTVVGLLYPPMAGFQDKVAFIWSVADLLRGDYKPHEYGKVIFPLTVLRRLDCVLEPTKAEVLRQAKGLKPEARGRQWSMPFRLLATRATPSLRASVPVAHAPLDQANGATVGCLATNGAAIRRRDAGCSNLRPRLRCDRSRQSKRG